MIVYRLSKEKYAGDLSGKGAELSGGRWNHKGTKVLYTSDSRALCTAEIAVHCSMGNIPHDYFMISIEIPDDITVQEIKVGSLPKSWKSFPYAGSTQKIGDEFIKENRLLILKVPSAVVQGDHNYLINPAHEDFQKIKITGKERFVFDQRLFR
ncbi:MAG: RES family NAD+ phosphorylase [Bacteroidetes bacterium]|nr:RES family NAD+ phosphorylase [Bacteroidota bacterium]